MSVDLSVPKEMGGPGKPGTTTPEHLFAAGYAACFHSAVKRIAADRKVAIGNSIVEADVAIGPGDSGPGYTLAVELRVILPGAYVEAAKEVVHRAHMLCPYSNATRGNIDVKVVVTDD